MLSLYLLIDERDSLITLRRELQKKQKVLQMLKEKVDYPVETNYDM